MIDMLMILRSEDKEYDDIIIHQKNLIADLSWKFEQNKMNEHCRHK